MPHFTFHGTSGNPSAFAFIDVKPKGSQPYKIIAYLPQYDPKNLSVTPFPYREKFSGPENLKTFRGELKGKLSSPRHRTFA
jgi:hypothetical protein